LILSDLTAMTWKDKPDMYIQICINYQQKATSVMNMGKLKNLPKLNPRVGAQAMMTSGQIG